MEALTPNKAAAQLKYGKTLKRRELSQVPSQNLFLAAFFLPSLPSMSTGLFPETALGRGKMAFLCPFAFFTQVTTRFC